MLVNSAMTLLALATFSLVLLIPGLWIGSLTNLWEFRRRSLGVQLAMGVVLSEMVVPVASYLVGRGLGLGPLRVFFWGLLGLSVVALAMRGGELVRRVATGWNAKLLGWGVLWVVVALGITIDLEWPGQLQRSFSAMDQISHVAITDAITRTGLPPDNPYVYPGKAIPLFYYVFWYLMCSLVEQLSGTLVTARNAVQAGVLYVGFSLAALYACYREVLLPRLPQPVGGRKTPGWGLILFLVTGLDAAAWVLMWALHRFLRVGPGPGRSIEHWNEQISAWLGVVMVSPHHIVGVVIVFGGLLALLELARAEERTAWKPAVLAGFAFASAVGTSTYVTFGMATGLGLWMAYEVLIRRRAEFWPMGIRVAGAGVLAGLLAVPLFVDLSRAMVESQRTISFTIRAFEIVDYWLPSIVRVLKKMPEVRMGLRLVLLPLNYLLEMGFFLATTLVYWRWRRSQPGALSVEERCLLALAVASTLVCTFLKSNLLYNDLGWRAFLVAQFAMLVWSAQIAPELWRGGAMLFHKRWERLAVVAFFATGLLGTAGELVGYRVNYLEPRGQVAVQERDAYEWIAAHTPKTAIVAYNPKEDLIYSSSLSVRRQVVAANKTYAPHFGVGRLGAEVWAEWVGYFAKDPGDAARTAIERRYGVTVLVVEAGDGIWQDRNSWVWRRKPDYENPQLRVYLQKP